MPKDKTTQPTFVKPPSSVWVDGAFHYPEDMRVGRYLQDVVEELTFKAKSGERLGFGAGEVVNLCKIDKGIVTVPRKYAYENFYKNILESAEDRLAEDRRININFNEERQASRPELKKKQDALISEFLSKFMEQPTPFRQGLLSSGCGTGKTTMSLKIISTLKRPTIVFVHKEFLMEQWKQRILEFTDVKEDEIGHAQADTCSYEGKKIVLAMLQSVTQRKYPDELYQSFPVACFDECHIMAARVFSTAVPMYNFRYGIGLSATTYRKDGLQPVFEWYLGDTLAKATETEVTPKIYQIPYDNMVPEKYYKWGSKVLLGRLTTLLSKDPRRNAWIVNEIIRAVGAGRKVMLLSDRLEHLDELKKMLLCSKVAATISLYVGGMKKEERKASEQANIILASTAMAKEGLDICDLDTIFLVASHSDVQQSVGRVLRAHPGKKEPIVVDLVDTGVPICVSFAYKRLQQYRSLGYEIAKSI